MTELAVVVGLMSLVAAALIGFLTASQNNLQRQTARTISNDEVRLAAESFDRDVRSGNVVYDPSTENYAAGDVRPGLSLRVYSQAVRPATNSEPRCIQWRITPDGELQRRSWTAYYQGSPGQTVSGWRIVASHLRNDTTTPAFTRTGTNIVNLRLLVNSDATGVKGSTVEVKQSVSGRNTLHFPTGQASEVCGPATGAPSTGTWQVPAYG